jgi:hypothetical protein
LGESLKEAGFSSLHMPALGSPRKAREDSINNGWRNASFQGYAGYMQTAEFWNALEELMMHSRQGPSPIIDRATLVYPQPIDPLQLPRLF